MGSLFSWVWLKLEGGDSGKENGGIVKRDVIAENGGRV